MQLGSSQGDPHPGIEGVPGVGKSETIDLFSTLDMGDWPPDKEELTIG